MDIKDCNVYLIVVAYTILFDLCLTEDTEYADPFFYRSPCTITAFVNCSVHIDYTSRGLAQSFLQDFHTDTDTQSDVYSESPSKLIEACKSFKSRDECVKPKLQYCDDALRDGYEYIRPKIYTPNELSLCSNHSLAEYQTHYQCYKNISTSGKTEECTQQFLTTTRQTISSALGQTVTSEDDSRLINVLFRDDADPDPTVTAKYRANYQVKDSQEFVPAMSKICNSFEKMKHCVKSAIEAQCNKEAARYYGTLMDISFSAYLCKEVKEETGEVVSFYNRTTSCFCGGPAECISIESLCNKTVERCPDGTPFSKYCEATYSLEVALSVGAAAMVIIIIAVFIYKVRRDAAYRDKIRLASDNEELEAIMTEDEEI